jgi:hypothetical protein
VFSLLIALVVGELGGENKYQIEEKSEQIV